ncbi:LysR substrate-binding domain-containing protein [Achromobacter sp. NPDC058515]|uniref:LysR substrate-binding domain-containing protein n=1 Tax=Achromobacter sp. NPDC058515 TaxID=3346533 RepID=UPI003656A7F9
MKHSVVSLSRKVKFYQLVVFDQIVTSGSLIKAAAALNLTQPSVTKIVQELEYHFKAPLLIRGHRGVTVTELGELVSRRLHYILAALCKLNDDVEAYHLGTSGGLLIGTLNSASVSALPGALDLLMERAPGLTVSVRQGHMNHLLSGLKVGELDMVIGRIPDDWKWHPDAGELTATPLYREEYCVVAGANHALQETGPDAWKNMHEFPWLLPPRDSSFRHVAESLFTRVGMPPPSTIVESTSLLTNISLLQNNRALALMVKGIAHPFIRSGMLKTIDVGEELDYGPIGCFLAAGRDREPALDALLECLDESARSLDARTVLAFENSSPQEPAPATGAIAQRRRAA